VIGAAFLFPGLGVLLLSVLLVLSGAYRPSDVKGSNAEAIVSLIQAIDRNDKSLETGLLAGVTYTSVLIDTLPTTRPIRISDIPKSTGLGFKLVSVRGWHTVNAVWVREEVCMDCNNSMHISFKFDGKKLLEVRNDYPSSY
jgi:hypothetical protein